MNPSEGRVFQLHRKPETAQEPGLPKNPVPEIYVTALGVQGDFNRFRHEERHDDPAQAVLIEPLETLRTLQGEGWPIRPGDLGENVTSEGVEYEAYTPGRRFRIGTAIVSISKACTPCTNLYTLPYVGPSRGLDFLRVMMDRRGWYAEVVVPGFIRLGDPIGPL